MFYNTNYPQHILTQFSHYVRHEEMINQEIPLDQMEKTNHEIPKTKKRKPYLDS